MKYTKLALLAAAWAAVATMAVPIPLPWYWRFAVLLVAGPVSWAFTWHVVGPFVWWCIKDFV
jgi:hypothetical protein